MAVMKELAVEIVEDMIKLHKDLYPFDMTDDDYDLVFDMTLEQIMDDSEETVEQLQNEIAELELEGDYFKEEIKLAKNIIAKIEMIERRK